MKKPLGPNYWKLWSASAVSNLGDGVAVIAYPWLASLITRDGFKLGLVVLAGRLPWLLFSLPAGVLADRFDRRRLVVVMDLFRAILTAGVVALVLANTGVLDIAAETGVTPSNEAFLLAALIGASFLFGVAEVVRDNTAQTLMPALVERDLLETANGRLWAAELLMNQSVGPPLGGVLIGVALVAPFMLHSATFAISALVLATLVGTFRTPVQADAPRPAFRKDLAEGFRYLWSHPLLRPLAITLGVVNGLTMMAQTTFVLFAQDVLALSAAQFGLLTTSGAVGGVAGALAASKVTKRLRRGATLYLAMVVFGVTQLIIGLFPDAILAWTMMVIGIFFAMVWNVITVSLRQRIIPDRLLGRVNSVYRFFGWGMMSLGAILGGALVSISGPIVGREWSLRLPFVVAGVVQIAMLLYAYPHFNTGRIEEAERRSETEGLPA